MSRTTDRAYAWLAIAGDDLYPEEAHGSLSVVPREPPIQTLLAIPTDHAEPNAAAHSVVVPADAIPLCFWRTAITTALHPDAPRDVGRATTLVLGWERDGQRALLWCYGDGSTVLAADDPEEADEWQR